MDVYYTLYRYSGSSDSSHNTHDETSKKNSVMHMKNHASTAFSKASANLHDGTKILKNHVKPKIALTEACIMYNGSSKYLR